MGARPSAPRLPVRQDVVPMARPSGGDGAAQSDPFEAPDSRPPRAFHALFDDAPRPTLAVERSPDSGGQVVEPPRKRARRDVSGSPGPDVGPSGVHAPKVVPYRRWATGDRAGAAAGSDWADDDDLAVVDAEIAAGVRGRPPPDEQADEPELDASCPSALVGLLDLRGVSPLRRQRDADAQLERELWGSVLQEPTREPAEGLNDLSDDGGEEGSSDSEDDEALGWNRPDSPG